MDAPPEPNQHPRELIAEACARYGEATVAAWCAGLLTGTTAPDDPTSPSLGWIGGRHALHELRRGAIAERRQDYWVRTWAARALLYVWTPEAIPAICAGLDDEAWRVREMCARVIRHREVGEATDLLPPLLDDPTARVRTAVLLALGAIADGDASDAIHDRLTDDNPAVRAAAERALRQLSDRLDRTFE